MERQQVWRLRAAVFISAMVGMVLGLWWLAPGLWFMVVGTWIMVYTCSGFLCIIIGCWVHVKAFQILLVGHGWLLIYFELQCMHILVFLYICWCWFGKIEDYLLFCRGECKGLGFDDVGVSCRCLRYPCLSSRFDWGMMMKPRLQLVSAPWRRSGRRSWGWEKDLEEEGDQLWLGS